MALHRTWWGKTFVEALEDFIDTGRLQRGKAYRTDNRILEFFHSDNQVSATLRGNVNPYFGVTEEPRYKVTLVFQKIPKRAWQDIINTISGNAGWLSKLMLNEIPSTIEDAFGEYCLLPKSFDDIEAQCSCPDYASPCKHIAGVYYHIANLLDATPMLLFQLRGISQENLQLALKKTELGQVFAEHLSLPNTIEMEYDTHYFSPIISMDKALNKIATSKSKTNLENNLESHAINHSPKTKSKLDKFWSMSEWDLPTTEETSQISASLIKKQGDYPDFWTRNNSFIEAMEIFYQSTRKKNDKILF
ncbi:MAG: SWIM zinc finger family protein [Rhizobiales bacterium]|nr:SWIM zinc finger family protein [Hyphomicrobiales bacterium]